MRPGQFARFCGWCGKGLDPWARILVFLGLPASHGICPECEAKANAEVETLLQGGAA